MQEPQFLTNEMSAGDCCNLCGICVACGGCLLCLELNLAAGAAVLVGLATAVNLW